MVWTPNPDNPWKADMAPLVSRRTRRILELQGLHTVAALADAVHTERLAVYPESLQEDVRRAFQQLRPALTAFNERCRVRQTERAARLQRLDWPGVVVARPLTDDERRRLAGVDVMSLDCLYGVKHGVRFLGGTDALDAATTNRSRLLRVDHCGPAGVDALRVAIERALQGHILAEYPDHTVEHARKYSMAGRSLEEWEIVELQRYATDTLPLSTRARRAVRQQHLESWLDLAAAVRLDFLVVRGCGDGTLRDLRTLFRDRLNALRAESIDVRPRGGNGPEGPSSTDRGGAYASDMKG